MYPLKNHSNQNTTQFILLGKVFHNERAFLPRQSNLTTQLEFFQNALNIIIILHISTIL